MKKKIYFVCSGNTCRSPMAEQLLKHALAAESEPLNRFQPDSFGTGAFPGSPASENSQYVISKVGLDLKNHRSKSADQIDINDAYAFFCMTSAHRDTLISFYGADPKRVFLFRQWVESDMTEISDPFGMGVADYQDCLNEMIEAVPSLLNFLRKDASLS